MANGGFVDGGATDQPKEAEMPIDLATMPSSSTEITDLVERLRTGRCVLCAGSRLSAADGERTFRALVGKLLAELPESDADGARQVLDTRPLAAAGFVRRRLGDRFAEELKKAAAPFAELSETVRLLGELPFRAIVTTAYDDAFERAFTKDGVAPRIYTPRDHEALKNDGKLRFVFKALGDPSRADSIVWSAEDLNSALADGGYRTVAHDLYRSRSFLFVGFDGRDPDLAILPERARARSSTSRSFQGSVPSRRKSSTRPMASASCRPRTWPSWRGSSRKRSVTRSRPRCPTTTTSRAGSACSPKSRRAPMRRAAQRSMTSSTRCRRSCARRATGRSWSTSCSGAWASSRRWSGAPRCCSRSPRSSSTRWAICRRRSPRSSPLIRSIRGRRRGRSWSGWRRRPARGASCSRSWRK